MTHDPGATPPPLPHQPAGPPPAPPPHGQTPPAQAPYGQPPQGQAPYGQPPQGQAPYGQPPQGQAPYGQPPQGQAPYGQPPQGQAPYGQPVYQPQPTQQPGASSTDPQQMISDLAAQGKKGLASLSPMRRNYWFGAMGAAALVFIGSFLPWVTLSVISVAGTSGDGMITLFLSILAAGFLAAAVFVTSNIARMFHWVALGAGVLIVLITLVTFSNLGDTLFGAASPGIGLILVVLGGIALAVLSFLFGRQDKAAPASGTP